MATKQKLSTEASKPAQTLLRDRDSQKTQGFDPAHADRLLAYPGSRWEEVDAKKPELPEADATGHATEV